MKTTVQSNVVINLIRTITMTLLSFVTFPMVTRILGDSALGSFSWATSFVYYFTILAKISIPNIAVRECAKIKNDPDKLSMKIQEFFILQCIMTLISFTLMSVIVFSIPLFKENNIDQLIFIVSMNFLCATFAFEWVFTALGKQTYLAIRSIVILAFVDILIFALIRYKENLFLYAFLTTSVNLLTVVSNLIYLPKLIKFKKTRKYNFKQYIPALSILFLISVFASIYDKTDSFILGIIDPSKAQVGSYVVGMKAVEIIIGIIVALGGVFTPKASEFIEQNDEQKFANLIKFSINICFIIVVPSIALLISMANPITSLMAGTVGYKDAATILISLASLCLTFSLSQIIYTQILIPMKKEKIYLYAIIAGSILNIASSLLFGLLVFKDNPGVGISIATAISDLIVLIILIVKTWKDVKNNLFNFNNLKILILGGIIFLVSYFVGPLIFNASFEVVDYQFALLIELISMFMISLIIYVLGLLISKEKLVRSIIHK